MAPSRSKAAPIWPPPPPCDETDAERTLRLDAEAQAKRVSDFIDEELVAEKDRRKRSSGAQILLLGQAESGKSTVLKNLQLHFAPVAFQAEAEVWRPVIHLNLVRSINFIVNILTSRYPNARDSVTQNLPTLSGELRKCCLSLTPLRQVEESLTKGISGSNESHTKTQERYHPARASEVSIRSGIGWKAILNMRRQSDAAKSESKSQDIQNRRILSACAEEIVSFWNHPEVQKFLRDEEINLRDQPGFFLDDLHRITQEEYKPTPSDILRARTHTIGPEEHRIVLETLFEQGKVWTVYDVGGSRSQRAAWVQFFDNVNVIIFLAPISAFNQALAEDDDVNRLTDTLKLWQNICSNKLLSSVEFILFLNKLDILDSKLKAGVQFSKYVTAYKARPNETKPVAKYLLDVFITIHQSHSPKRRKVHPHLTCAIDTRATASVIKQIQEVILVKTLSQTSIL